jgi:large subunit ribosomal protein L25
MEMQKLAVKKRDLKDNNEAIRLAGFIPAVVYGPDQEPISIMLEARALEILEKAAGLSSVIELNIEGGDKLEVLLHDVQRDPIKDHMIHLDFYKLQKGHQVTTHLPIEFTGASQAKIGVLFIEKDSITVKCLPKDLISGFEISLDKLNDDNTTLTVADLEIPETLTLMDEGHLILASVRIPKQQLADEEEVAVVAEGEEGAEGEAAVEGDKKEEEKK